MDTSNFQDLGESPNPSNDFQAGEFAKSSDVSPVALHPAATFGSLVRITKDYRPEQVGQFEYSVYLSNLSMKLADTGHYEAAQKVSALNQDLIDSVGYFSLSEEVELVQASPSHNSVIFHTLKSALDSAVTLSTPNDVYYFLLDYSNGLPGISAKDGYLISGKIGVINSKKYASKKIFGGGIMKVLVACEYSGRVRQAFRNLGHDAWSCDLLPSEDNSPFHIQGDVSQILNDGWDLMIAHPPCTHLAVSGARWFKDKQQEQVKALSFVALLLNAPIKKIALENPVSIISTKIRKPDCIIQPWQFGHGEVKKTCLWLKNLPSLQSENIVSGRVARVHRMSPSPDRWKERSRTYSGVALAMANQWGGL